MPSYKTHSIHSEEVLLNIDNRVEIDSEDLKKFALGPDSLILTDYKLFEYQHGHRTSEYFMHIINYIKQNHFQDNSQVMAFLYGQLDHFVLDLVTHPLIVYMSEKKPKRFKFNPHALIEMWIDDYISKTKQVNNKDYYKKEFKLNQKVEDLINTTYDKVFGRENIKQKYELGVRYMLEFDNLIRQSKAAIYRLICDLFKIGDIFYSEEVERVLPYLNLKKEQLRHPVTGQYFDSSFDELWDKSIETSSELIEDVNNYLYRDKKIENYLLHDNISYNTGLPCRKRIKSRFVKKYK